MKKEKKAVIRQKTDRRNNIIVTKPISAAGGVIISFDKEGRPHVLLIYRSGLWDLPKGKREEGESLKKCALREVSEEVGIQEEPVIIADLMQTYHEYKQGDTHFGKDTRWYGMQLPTNDVVFNPQTEEGIEKVEWVPLQEAQKRVGYENLVKVLGAAMGKLSLFRKH